MRNRDWHPGISMHKLPVGAGFAGFIFAAGMVIVFLLKLPVLWAFFIPALALGAGIALLIHRLHHSCVRNHLTTLRLH